MIYSVKVLEYFADPKHAYRMDQPDSIGVVGDLSCGDFFVMYIRVLGGRLTEVSYQIFGCPAAIATCEAAAEMATGKTLDEAQHITDDSVAEFLGGLPEMKLHCSNSAADALHCAIADYHAEGQRGGDQTTTEVIEDATR
jgi:nitrogen fixation NifU-like protein